MRPASATPARSAARLLTASAVALGGAVVVPGGAVSPAPAQAAATSVALVGSLQDELGCPADWDPACAATELAPTDEPGVFSADFEVPAGAYEYKVALDDAWDESYGADATGDNSPLVLAGATVLRVTYDDATHRTSLTPLGSLAGDYVPADDALVAAPARQPGSSEQFYFVMTDRFANGDPTNDTGGLTGDRLTTGFDPTDKGFYQGGDLAGLREQLDYIEGLGTSAIWLTPSFLNRPVQGTGANASAGYHGYWITDFTQIDPHLGSNAELEALIADAHARGIKVYFDIITNHTADVIDYAEGTYDYVDQATAPYRTADGTVFDPATYAGTGTFPELDPATSFPYTPVVDPADADVKVPAWLNDPTLYHNRGNSTWEGESVTYGDFDGLDDLMTEHPTVVEGFVDVYQDWIDLGIDGFRIDTVKHVNIEFWEQWTTEVLDYARAQGKPDFFMFGEVYDADAAKLSPYVRNTDMSSTLDFTFQSAAQLFARGSDPRGLAQLFASDDMYTTPTTSATALPTFLGNHDMGRIGYFVAPDGDGLERSELAHSLMYLTRGQPVVYYGDEQGFAGPGGDKSARQTLFASQTAEYTDQPLLTGETAGSVDRYDTDAPLYRHIAELAELREATPALESGAQVERPVSGDGEGSVYAFSRVHRDEKVEHLVALNNEAAPATVTVDTLTPGATFAPLLGDHAAVTADADGLVTVTVPAYGALALVADGTVAPGAGSIAVDVPGAGGAVSGVAPVGADVADAWAETSFAYRLVGTDAWVPLGTAEDTTPRVFHDTTDLPRGTLVEYRAVSVDAAGERVAASTFASVGIAVDGAEPPPAPGGRTDLFVTVPGSANAEMGCTADWAPECEAIALTHRGAGVYSGTFSVPAGTWEYKVAVGGSWVENYGAGGVPGGDNVRLSLAADQQVTFVYDDATKWFTSSAQGPLVTLAGSFQSEIGCPGDWQPDCVVASLQDGDGDGTYTWTAAVPAGSYEVKVVHGLSWDENYGEGGAPGGANIPFTATGEPLTFTYDIATHVLTIGGATPGLPGLGQAQAHWVDAGTIAVPAELADAADGAWRLHHVPDGSLEVADGAVEGGEALDLTPDPDGLSADQLDRFPALAGYAAFTVDADRATAEALLRGELLVAGEAADGELAAATGVQIPGVVDDLFAEDAADRTLGAAWQGNRPTLAVWAPTAQDVDLLLWQTDRRGRLDLTAEPERVAMDRKADGTWTVRGKASWREAAYLYEVTVYAPTTDVVEVNRVTDPYTVALTLNSTHSVLVDLDDRQYQPRAWRRAEQPVVEPVDQTIYELNVRDFSITDETVPEELRGTYLAFAEDGTAGREHLQALADAGLTTVHLLPTFDIATIEEDRALQATPPCDLAALPPDSPEQQACIDPIRDADGYNWGYDPLHFTAPEGSYAVDAHGGERVAEFRTMVGALHEDGLQVVLDQVFNHTAASGQDPKSVLDRVVPGYYHRLSATGAVETSTCCQNLATEHAMAEKLMVDSVVTWARDYKVDGFRFDLMGHHSVETMQAVREALDALTERRDGVDGSAVYLYGEGWNFGEVADNRLFTQATQGQLDGTGIGTFSDRLRDAVRGGGPFDENPGIQGFGSGAFTDPNGDPVNGTEAEQLARLQHQADLVRLGLAGNLEDYAFLTSDGTVRTGAELDYNGQPAGYATSPEEVITYVDAHDNETLFDSLTLKLPQDTPMADRVRMNTLSLATTALAQTPSFWHAGTDLLRSKSLDRNSYNSGDWFNEIDWSGQESTFGRGLPPAADNEDKWPFQQPLLADPALRPGAQDMAAATEQAQDLLRLRFSTELFRLGDAELIEDKVTFPGSGPDALPGVIAMHVDDTVGEDVDRDLDGLLVVFNASDEPAVVAVPDLAGDDYELSPVLAEGSDDVVRGTTWDEATGTVTVPARTVTVLVDDEERHGGGHGGGLGWWWGWFWSWWPPVWWPWG
ncbi:pullulanase-type alpha-1,6-glucosidase [Actinotalea ferrariae]|uniref:pullulanase-type alpha-1,6-glucosidase n=1 Tax=Actinotalea ferrariae TaxID=1386098 RepID=UPI001C8C8FB0|nr:pullulanase-type alpha-1,6-glucosidase [Actinotalea ferrariae]MBX9243928.1 pullulanase-type alpha-1,6-glucosidase [Actinotalea ferrariae]